MKVVRVTKTEFELDDGSVHPICPPLQVDMTVDEFQECYERACVAVKGVENVGRDCKDVANVGSLRKNADHKNTG